MKGLLRVFDRLFYWPQNPKTPKPQNPFSILEGDPNKKVRLSYIKQILKFLRRVTSPNFTDP